MKIQYRYLDEIKPYENNAKLHPKEQIEQIKNSIKEFGNNDPIAIDENDVIIEGHGRYEALKELGYEDTPVIVLDGLSEEQKNAYRIVHNQLTMNTSWDMDMLKEELSKINLNMNELGFEQDLLDEVEEEFTEVEDDNFDIDKALEEIEEPTTKTGDVWLLGNHRLICGDSTSFNDIEKLMNGEEVDLFLTDPPYNINVSNSQGMTIENDNMDKGEFIKFLSDVFINANTFMKPGAPFYIWYADTSALEFHQACRNTGWTIRENLIWVKNQFILGRQDYHWRHEPCLYGWKDGAAHYFINDRTQSTVIDETIDLNTITHEDLVEYVKNLLNETTILYENKPTINDMHPTMKPITLIARLVKNSSIKNANILDLFGGSGSTLIACEQLNRKCFTMELDPKYCDVIIKRWETLTGRKAVLLND